MFYFLSYVGLPFWRSTLHTNTSHKLCFSPQVLQKKLHVNPLHAIKFTQKRLDFSATPAAPPPHTYLKLNSGTSTLVQLLFHTAHEERNSTYTPSRVHPGRQERNFPEWQKPSAYARPIYLRVSVDGQPPVPSQLHSDRTLHFEFLHIGYRYLTIFSCKARVTIPMHLRFKHSNTIQ